MTHQTPSLRPAAPDSDGRRVQQFARIERAEMTPDLNPAMRALHRARRETALPLSHAQMIADQDPEV